MNAKYDRIGVNYANLRMPDARIAAVIHAALGPAQSVLNVGAGTGSYEPGDRDVTALEPSSEMIAQRADTAAPVIQGHAEKLPFGDDSFDAAMAILTVHHWSDRQKGLGELRRVTRGPIVLLTFDPAHKGFWLADYIPELVALDLEQMPRMADYEAWLGPVDVTPVPIPKDCTDGFLCAYWQRPEAYLDPRVRAAISSFWAIGDVSDALSRLQADIESGAWAARYGEILNRESCDFGYRMVVAQ
ncbi:MAG: methyltransferase domain-containing protein [Silicimonas sp.]|nr:methyltransferase domain-containing protein [Silicimonas sp.]